MGYKTLELTLISGKDLKNVSLLGKMDVYVVVSLSGDPRSKQRTPVHRDGGSSPYWNHTVRYTVDEDAGSHSGLTVVFELKHKSTFMDKDVGEVRVPLKDLIQGFGDMKEPQTSTYQVRRPSGKPKGELTLSYRLTDAVHQRTTAYPPQAAAAYPPPQTAYPYPPMQAPMGYPYQQQGGYGSGYGYGYPMQGQAPQRPRKNGGGFGMGLGAGLLGGVLGGMLMEDMVSDAYDDGYYDGGDGGGFDGGDGGGFDDGGFDGGDMGGMDF